MILYDASAKTKDQESILGLPELPILYGNNLWPNTPRPNRVSLDQSNIRSLINLINRSHKQVVFDIEESSWDQKYDELITWCKIESPELQIGFYNVPYVTFGRNITAKNNHYANWVDNLITISRSEWFKRVDFCCPDVYPEGAYLTGDSWYLPTFEDWKKRIDYSLYLIKKVIDKPIIPVFRKQYPDNTTCSWADNAIEWLAQLVDAAALWEGP